MKEFGGLLAEAVFQVGRVDGGGRKEAGKEDAPGLLDHRHHLLVGGNGDGAQVVEAAVRPAAGDQLFHHRRDVPVELVGVFGVIDALQVVYFLGEHGVGPRSGMSDF